MQWSRVHLELPLPSSFTIVSRTCQHSRHVWRGNVGGDQYDGGSNDGADDSDDGSGGGDDGSGETILTGKEGLARVAEKRGLPF